MFAYIHTKEHFSCQTQWKTKQKNKLPPGITSIGLWVPWCEKALLTNHHHQSVLNTSKSKSEPMPESNSWKLELSSYLESWILQHCRLDPNMILGKYFTKWALPFPKLDMQRRHTHSSGSGTHLSVFKAATKAATINPFTSATCSRPVMGTFSIEDTQVMKTKNMVPRSSATQGWISVSNRRPAFDTISPVPAPLPFISTFSSIVTALARLFFHLSSSARGQSHCCAPRIFIIITGSWLTEPQLRHIRHKSWRFKCSDIHQDSIPAHLPATFHLWQKV